MFGFTAAINMVASINSMFDRNVSKVESELNLGKFELEVFVALVFGSSSRISSHVRCREAAPTLTTFTHCHLNSARDWSRQQVQFVLYTTRSVGSQPCSILEKSKGPTQGHT